MDPVDCNQFSQVWTAREAAKAPAGYLGVKGRGEDAAVVAVCTAAWGCGTYKGNVALKFVLQWLAAAAAGISLVWECKYPPASTFAEKQDRSLVHALRCARRCGVWESVCKYGSMPVETRDGFCAFLVASRV